MQPIATDAERAYETLVAGGLALVPTDVGYGLIALEEGAVERIYACKGRPLAKPCVTVANAAIFDEVVLPIEPSVRAWIHEVTRLTPLAIVAALDPQSRLLASMSAGVRAQATHEGTIATFHNAGAVVARVAELAFADGRVVVGSSANLSGTGNNDRLQDVPESMRRAADLVIDRGPAWYGNAQRLATTILDLPSGTFRRQGVNFALIERAWHGRQHVSPNVHEPSVHVTATARA